MFEFCDKKYKVVIEGIKDYEIYLESYKGICYNDVAINIISSSTGLSIEEIEKLKYEVNS